MRSFLQPLFLFIAFQSFAYCAIGQEEMEQWVDSVFSSLSEEERIAQLMIVRANQPGKKYDHNISRYIRKYNIGGVAFFRGNALEQAQVTNKWQNLAKTPLFVSIDA
jgi:hypothetical protein